MSKRVASEEETGSAKQAKAAEKAPRRRNVGSSFRVSPERDSEVEPHSSSGRRSSIRNQPSGERRRSSIRSAPTDDATIFARSASFKKDGEAGGQRKRRIIVIHGDPSKPNPILPGGKWDDDDFEAVATLRQALDKLADDYTFDFKCNHDTLIQEMQAEARNGTCDLVLQFCDEGFMNHPKMELHLTAFLEMIGIPYTGTGPVTIGMTYDKQVILDIAKSIGIPVPRSVLVDKDELIVPTIKSEQLVYPVFIKPNSTDGSYGITTKSICRSDEDVQACVRMVREQFHISGGLLIQEYLEGADMNTGIIGNPPGPCHYLPVTEEDYSEVPAHLPRILGFESKWDENSPYWKIGTKVTERDKATTDFMNECSAKLFQRIGVRDYARFDWKLDANGQPRMLESNPNCGWSYDAHLQRMCALDNLTYSQMLRMIIEAAFQRLDAHAKSAQEETFVDLSDVSQFRSSEKQVAPTMRGDLLL
eukprot:TRINITY_DN19277_c0_g1_i1.p1 TRINITY_DN19277_c0_g1~~TRINITY_DN19277_c0_g1_i1.p1  ORF type:complete len:476 (+),score=172.09 TRINITY_DN19277_c0_g1_i1:1530-2957(+)